MDYEVIVVDDGSDDATGEELAESQRHHPRLRILRHGMNRGQSAAIASGVEAARAVWVVTLDGDGQNDPLDIQRLLAVRDAASARVA
jgi:dolichol-phosphate mannosyltransferase